MHKLPDECIVLVWFQQEMKQVCSLNINATLPACDTLYAAQNCMRAKMILLEILKMTIAEHTLDVNCGKVSF